MSAELTALIVDLLIQEEVNLSNGYKHYCYNEHVELSNIAYRILEQKESPIKVLQELEFDLSDGYIFYSDDVQKTLERISNSISFLITSYTAPSK
jgi:hypothetical protein